MLWFAGVMEIELSDFVVEPIMVDEAQPVIDINPIGRAKEISFIGSRHAFMLASRRSLKSLSIA